MTLSAYHLNRTLIFYKMKILIVIYIWILSFLDIKLNFINRKLVFEKLNTEYLFRLCFCFFFALRIQLRLIFCEFTREVSLPFSFQFINVKWLCLCFTIELGNSCCPNLSQSILFRFKIFCRFKAVYFFIFFIHFKEFVCFFLFSFYIIKI